MTVPVLWATKARPHAATTMRGLPQHSGGDLIGPSERAVTGANRCCPQTHGREPLATGAGRRWITTGTGQPEAV